MTKTMTNACSADGRRTRRWAIAVLSTLIAGLAATAAHARLTRGEIDELIKRKVDATVMMSLVGKYCVDFDVDDDLLKRVDSSVFESMRACRGSVEEASGSSATALPRPTMPAPPPLAPGVARYTLAPILVDGKVDLETTSLLLDRLRDHVAPIQVLDPFALGVHFGTSEGFHAGAPIDKLKTAAKAAGATGIVIAKATSYKQFQDYGVRLEANLVDVDTGEASWKAQGRGTSGNRSWNAAKRRAVNELIRDVPADP